MEALPNAIMNDDQYETFLALASCLTDVQEEEDGIEAAPLTEAESMTLFRNILTVTDAATKNAVLNTRADGGMLILNLAVMSGKLEACQALVEHGAGLHNTDGVGNSAMGLLQNPALNIPNREALRDYFTAQHAQQGVPLPGNVAPAPAAIVHPTEAGDMASKSTGHRRDGPGEGSVR